MGRLGVWEILAILLLVLLLFGPRRLPEIGRAVGRTIQEFKRATNRGDENEEQGNDKESKGGGA